MGIYPLFIFILLRRILMDISIEMEDTLDVYESLVGLERISLDELYHSTPFKVDLLSISPEVVDKMSISKFQNKTVPLAPECMCGAISGTSNLGEVCMDCHTPVMNYIGNYNTILWVSAVGDYKFIAPHYWKTLDSLIQGSDEIDTLAWLTNTRYRSKIQPTKILELMVRDIPGFTRSYSYVSNNLRTILEYLYNSTLFSTKRTRVKALIDTLDTMPETIFSSYLPLPNKSLFLIENSSFGKEKASLSTGQLKSLSINYIDAIESGKDPGNTISRLISELASLYTTNVSEMVHGKNKIVRSSILGAKAPGSFRTVMTPISGPHKYDDFKMPWITAIVTFKVLLYHMLIMRNKGNYIDVENRLDKALSHYDHEICQYLLEILEDAKKMTNGRGIPVVMNRNPTQHRGSILLLYIIEIKIDPFDFTSEYSPIMCKSLNADLINRVL